MDGFSIKRLIIKIAVLAICYFVLIFIVHITDTVPYLEQAFTGDYETTDVRAQILLSVLRLSFYFLIPGIITVFEMFIIGNKYRLYFRRFIETVSIFYFSLYIVKVVYFFLAMDKRYGITILEGLDLALFTITTIGNIVCYKNPNFLVVHSKKKENNPNI